MRQLLPHERPLVQRLFEMAHLRIDLDELQVTPMSDGDMGSLALGADYESRRFGHQVAECSFVDTDDVVVSATLNVDSGGKPYEVDVWKVNFEPTIRWPTLLEVIAGPSNTALERTRER